MAKGMKTWLIAAAILVILGLLLFAGAMTANGWDFTKLDTVNYETNTYLLQEAFQNISITTDSADILFVPSGDGSCSVLCHEAENAKHTVSVENGTLIIQVVPKKTPLDYIGINFDAPKITVYLPDREYQAIFVQSSTGDVEIPAAFRFGDMDIFTSTADIKNFASASGVIKLQAGSGDILAEHISANALTLSVSTGHIDARNIVCPGAVSIHVSTGDTNLADIECGKLCSTGSTGDITLENVIATEALSLERSTGYVTFRSCDAAQLFIKTGTGDVTGSLLSDKIFIAHTGTGNVTVPQSASGGNCEITTRTGDIHITLSP